MKHKYLALFLVCIMLFSFSGLSGGTAVSHAATSEFAGGTGSSENPWQIATADQLDLVRNYLSRYEDGVFIDNSDKHFILMDNIDLGVAPYNEGTGWLPIGDYEDDTYFEGSFNGNGKIINGLTINRPDTTDIGLFGYTAFADIKNVSLNGVSIIGGDYTGSLVGSGYYGSISNCYAQGSIVAKNVVGGLVGDNSSGNFTNNYAVVSVTGTDNTGGLVGTKPSGTVTSSYYNSEIAGQTDTGKGEPRSTADMTYPYNVETTYVGWDFVNIWDIQEGVNSGYPFIKQQTEPEPTGDFAGGDGSENDPYQIATATQLDNIRNFLGSTNSGKYFILIDNINLGVAPYSQGIGWDPIGVYNNPFTGNFDGNGKTIAGLYINDSQKSDAGLFGNVVGGQIQNVALTNVNISAYHYTGGLAGYIQGTIANVFITGTVNGAGSVGGLVGSLSSGNVENAWAAVSVTGNSGVGGLVGTSPSGTITSSYYNSEVTSQTDTGKGEPRSTEDMTYPYNADTTYVGWDFVNSWDIKEGFNSGYPFIRQQTEPAGDFAGGDGSEADPFQITTAAQLNNIRNYLGVANTDKHFLLMNDIDLTSYVSLGGDGYNDGQGWQPIGHSAPWDLLNNANCFYGSFEGGEHTISGLFINRQPSYFFDYEQCGLFGALVDAEIRNLNLGVQVAGTRYTGGLAGYADQSTIENIQVEGDVTGNELFMGGLIGTADATVITDSSMVGTVNGGSDSLYVGGLIGSGSNTTITGCQASTTLSGAHNIGGLTGYIDQNTIITASYAKGIVTGTGTAIGGLSGYNGMSSISHSFSTVNVSGNDKVGGLCGLNSNSIVSDSYATGNVSGSDSVGGLIGDNSNSSINNSYAVGAVSGSGTYVGGLVGGYSPASIFNSFYDSVTTGQTSDNLSTNELGTPKTTAEMMQQATFKTWDFMNTWGIIENVTYPYLLIEPVTPTTYTVTYDGNGSTGGTVPEDSSSYLTDDTVTVLGNTGSLVKTGYSFAGWNTAANGSGTSYNAGDTFKITDNTILYAMWDAAMLAVLDQSQTDTTDKAGIFQYSWTAIGQDFTAGKTGNLTKISLYLSTPYYGSPGYNADITLEVRTQYNAGTVLATTTSYFSSSEGGTWVDFDFVSPVPVTAGTKYTFKCIPTASTALAIHHSSADVYPGQAFYSLSGGSYTYFHADWSFKTYVYESAPTYALTMVAAPAGSGTATDTSGDSPYASGTIVNISATPSSGYSFVSWTDSPADGTFGSTTSATTTYTMPAQAETVTANFEANTYTVTFASQGGSAPEPGSKTVTYASAYGTLPEVTRSGYTFNGWYTEATGGTKVTSTTMVTTADNHTLYAQWTALTTYTVTFNGNGDTPTSDSLQVEDGNTVETLPTAIWEGYTFKGWNTAANGSGTAFTTETTVTGDITVYAQWEAIPLTMFTVTFNGNGGTPSSDSLQVEDGSTVETLPTAIWEGYTFEGWNTAANGSGTAFTTETTVTGDITVYAQWEAIPPTTYNVAFDGNGGTPATQDRTVEDGSTVETLPTVTWDGYTLTGWNTAANGSGIAFTTETTVTGDITVYAQWEVIPPGYFNVSVSANPTVGGTVTGGGNYETGARVKVSAIAKENYAFIHWTEGSTVVCKGATYNFRMGTESRNLVAHFEPTVPATSWLVTTSAKPSEGGSVSGGGLFAEGDPVCVNAIANSGYRFINWTEGLIEVSTDAAYSFTMGTKERSLTANFLAEGTGWPKIIKLSVTDITDTSVILQLSQSVPDAEYYLVYTGDLLYRTFNATSFAAMEIDMLEPFTFYTFTVQALYPDYIETSDGPYVKVKTKR